VLRCILSARVDPAVDAALSILGVYCDVASLVAMVTARRNHRQKKPRLVALGFRI